MTAEPLVPLAGGGGTRGRIGEALVEAGLLTPERLEKALDLHRQWDMRLGEVLMAKGWVRAVDFYSFLAEQQNLAFVDLMREPPEDDLLDGDAVDRYVAEQCMPWRRVGRRVVWVTTEPHQAAETLSRHLPAGSFDLAVTSKFDILWALQQRFSERFTERAVFELYEQDPVNSARNVVTPSQVVFIWILLSAFIGGLAVAPVVTLLALNVFMTIAFLGTFVFKMLLTLLGGIVPKLDDQV